MLNDKIVCVGIGQCGSNFVSELEQVGFHAFYVNTSLEDLDLVDTPNSNKYHIKGTRGMAKDRNEALKCLLENNNANNICYAINDEYAMTDIVFMFYSLSGGTGGGMGNLLAGTMSELFPNKIINVVAVLPKFSDDIGMLANAIESLSQLKEIQKDGAINQVHLLTNQSREDIFSINDTFATAFDGFVNFDELDKMGNLDEEERERILTTHGMGVILDFSHEDFGNGLSEAIDTSIYSSWNKDPQLHGIILNRRQNKEINKLLVKDVLGAPLFTHQSTWNEDTNILLSVGMGFNDNVIIQLKQSLQLLMDKKSKIEKECVNNDVMEDVTIDISSITSGLRPKTRPVNNNSRLSSRRRTVETMSSILDKYKK